MIAAVTFVLALAVAGSAEADGAALVAKFECQRCHDGTSAPPAAAARDCLGCHRDILAGRVDAEPATLSRWRKNIRSLTTAPSLEGIGDLLRRDWVGAYLVRPHDVRPGLVAMMPRLAITEAQAEAIARHLVPSERDGTGPSPAPSRIEEGRRLYGYLGCHHCHDFSAAGIPRGRNTPYERRGRLMSVAALAPDLRHARARLQPALVAAWIRDPTGLRPSTTMPSFGLSADKAEAIASFIMFAPLEPASAVAPNRLGAPSAPRSRRVSFEDVSTRVFQRVCWHCHAAPDVARGDGDPGNTGGFGFAARGLDLSRYDDIAQEMFESDETGRSLLVRSLRARAREVAGRPVPGVRGMPLGLPPLPEADIRLVEAWVTQGHPR